MQAVATKTMTNLDAIKGAIAAKIDAASFSSWIAPLGFEISGNVLTLVAQNQFSADFIGGVHMGVISSVAAEFGLDAKIVVRGTVRASVATANDNNVQNFTPMATSNNTDASFDKFIASDENAFVLSACKKVATGAVSFSPLFIYGPAGCGKSLLAGCINVASNGRVVMMTGSQFVSEVTRSLHDRSVFAFKDFCRNCDTFILDDVQALAGKRATCDEFLQLIVDLRNAGKNIVLTACAAPNNLTGFDRRAQSLMASGLTADVVAPNAHVKTIMLRRAGVASDVAAAIASRIAGDGHLVGGVVNKIRAYVELMGGTVDMDVAQRLLADTLQRAKTPIAMVKSMCEKLGVSYDSVCGTGRSRSLVLARQIMMTVLKNATGMSLTEIGNMVGGRNHATVLYAIAQIEKLKQSDLVLNAQINDMIADCK
ncbi:MAG: DnaA/Hda family protein [Lachnospiraceae bacterium]|nr:DnaA/Hda family protein [Lachnospiraceae bacterium]